MYLALRLGCWWFFFGPRAEKGGRDELSHTYAPEEGRNYSPPRDRSPGVPAQEPAFLEEHVLLHHWRGPDRHCAGGPRRNLLAAGHNRHALERLCRGGPLWPAALLFYIFPNPAIFTRWS